MQSRRRLLPLFGVLFTTLATAAITAACGGDDKTVYVYVQADSGADAGNLRDGSTQVVIPGDDDDAGNTANSCSPGTAPAFTFKPAARYQNKCKDADLATFIAGCYNDDSTTDTCAAVQAQLPDCWSCLVGTPQDSAQHPFLQYDPEIPPIASTATCMAAFANDGTSTSDCSYAFGEVETCAYEACVPECLSADEPTFEACLRASISTVCTTGIAVFSSTKCQNIFSSNDETQYGFCLDSTLPDGGTLSNGDYFTMLGQLVCGAPPSDAGTDAGLDAGDGGDADASQ